MLSSRHAHALVWGLLHSCVRVGESRRVVDVDLELACLPAFPSSRLLHLLVTLSEL